MIVGKNTKKNTKNTKEEYDEEGEGEGEEGKGRRRIRMIRVLCVRGDEMRFECGILDWIVIWYLLRILRILHSVALRW